MWVFFAIKFENSKKKLFWGYIFHLRKIEKKSFQSRPDNKETLNHSLLTLYID